MAKKYIDADRLRAEIKIIQKSLEQRDVRFNQIKQIRTNCMIEFCKMLNNVIDSLQQEQPDEDLEKAALHVYESWMGGTMDHVRRDMITLGTVLNARKEK